MHNTHSSHKGGAEKSVHAKENTPENEPVQKSREEEDKTIGIGMPVTHEELKKLKEDAKKMDR